MNADGVAGASRVNQRLALIPRDAANILENAFRCGEIARAILPEGGRLRGIMPCAFRECKQLFFVRIPSSVERLGNYAFYQSGLFSIEFSPGSGLQSCGEFALAETNLEAVLFPATVEAVGDAALYCCPRLAKVGFETGSRLRRLGSSVLQGAAIDSFTLPPLVTRIPHWLFYDCKLLGEVNFSSNGLQSIGDRAFHCCAKLRCVCPVGDAGSADNCRLQLARTQVGSIGECAFEACTMLQEVDLPACLTTIKTGAFKGCSGLREVRLPAGLSIDPKDAFGSARITRLNDGQ